MYLRTLFNWLVPPLRPVERKILAVVEAKLDPERAQLFGAQVREINYVQRRVSGREVGLYVIRGGVVRRNPALALPMKGRERRLARVRVGVDASVHLADGHVCSIEYDGPPPAADSVEAAIAVEIFDPLADATLDATLPADYVTRRDGMQIGDLSIVGLDEAYDVRTEDGGYVVIGQLAGKGVLAVRKPGPALVFIDFEDDSVTELGESLEAAIGRLMQS